MSNQEIQIHTHTGVDGIAHLDIPLGIANQDIEITISYSTIEFEKQEKRIPGIDKNRFTVPDNFDDPLPPDILAAFEGNT